jgi:hypothetical protein
MDKSDDVTTALHHFVPRAFAGDVKPWLAACVYASGVLLASLVWRAHRARSGLVHPAPRVWAAVMGLFAVLVVDELLDVEQLLSVVGHAAVGHSATYNARRPAQVLLLVCGSGVGALVTGALVWRVRRAGAVVVVTVAAALALVGLIAVRMVSLHQLDAVLGWPLFGIGPHLGTSIAAVLVTSLLALTALELRTIAARRHAQEARAQAARRRTVPSGRSTTKPSPTKVR